MKKQELKAFIVKSKSFSNEHEIKTCYITYTKKEARNLHQRFLKALKMENKEFIISIYLRNDAYNPAIINTARYKAQYDFIESLGY